MMAPPVAGEKVPLRTTLGFLAMVLGLFMAILDIQIVASSIRDIQAGISASLDEISWVQTAYLIAEVVVIPLSGWLARLLSTRWLFVASAAGFTVMSVAAAFAWSVESMIVIRAVQGLFGGTMIPTVFAAIFRMFPKDRQTGATVLSGLVATTAPTLGPILGGWITQNYSWHWLFLINMFPGTLVVVAVTLLVDIDRPNLRLLRRIDYPGIIFAAIFLGTVEYVLEEGTRDDWFESERILTLTVIAGVTGALFLWRELACRDPVIDLRAFRDRNFAIGCLYSFIIGVGLFGSTFVLPLFLSSVRGYDSLQIGTVMMVTGAFQFLSGPLAGALERRIDQRLMLALGLAVFAVGLWLNGQLTAEAGLAQLFLPQALRGFALMFCFLPITSLALGRLPADEVNNASGLYNLMRNLGGAIGIAGINTIFERRFDLHYLHLAETVNAGGIGPEQAVSRLSTYLETQLIDTGRSLSAALKIVHGLMGREGTVMAYNDVFMTMSGVFIVGLLVMPLVRKAPPTPEPAF